MDVSILFKITGIGIIITILCQVLKKADRDDIATVVSLVGLVLVLSVTVGLIGDLFESVKALFGLY